jgi:bifunctional non-homologous end joining protein LigD
MIVRECVLVCQELNADKYYNLKLEQTEGLPRFIVNAIYGRRGSTGQEAVKGIFETLDEAIECYDKTRNSKMHGRPGHRYTLERSEIIAGLSGIAADTGVVGPNASQGQDAVRVDPLSRELPRSLPALLETTPQLLDELKEEREVEQYINDDRYCAQQKFDGKRMMLRITATVSGVLKGLQTYNKKGELCGHPSSYVDHAPETSCLLDGESIGDDYYAFDVLELDGTLVKNIPYAERMDRNNYRALIAYGHPWFVGTAWTTEEKRNLFETLKASNAEGIVFKPVDMDYRSGHGVGCFKYKFVATASCIVVGHTAGKRSISLGLKQNPVDLRIIPVGKCTIPPNKEIPAIGSRVEIRYLYAYPGGSLFQPVYLGERDDTDASECVITQLKYKGTSEARDFSQPVASTKKKYRKIIW